MTEREESNPGEVEVFKPKPLFLRGDKSEVDVCFCPGALITLSSALVTNFAYPETKLRQIGLSLSNGFDGVSTVKTNFDIENQRLEITAYRRTTVIQSSDPDNKIIGKHDITRNIGVIDKAEAVIIGAICMLNGEFVMNHGLVVLKKTSSGKYALVGHALLVPVRGQRSTRNTELADLEFIANERRIKQALLNPLFKPVGVILPADPKLRILPL